MYEWSELRKTLRCHFDRLLRDNNIISGYDWVYKNLSPYGCDIFCLGEINVLFLFLYIYPMQHNNRFKVVRQTFTDDCKIAGYDAIYILKEDISALEQLNQHSNFKYFDLNLNDSELESSYKTSLENFNDNIFGKKKFYVNDVFKYLDKKEVTNKFIMLSILHIYQKILLDSNNEYFVNVSEDIGWTGFEDDFKDSKYDNFKFTDDDKPY